MRFKAWASEPVTKLASGSVWWNEVHEIRVPEARHNLAQHVAAGEVLGRVGNLIRVP